MNAADHLVLFDSLPPSDKGRVASHFFELKQRQSSGMRFVSAEEAEKVGSDFRRRNQLIFRLLAEVRRDGVDDARSEVRC